MAFVMSLARTKRVKYIGQDGSEVFQEDNRWHFLNAENLASQVRKYAKSVHTLQSDMLKYQSVWI